MYDKIQNELRQRARERIQEGALPCGDPHLMYGGHGTGLTCSLCEHPISADEIEYELLFRTEDGSSREYRFHFLCHASWQLEYAHEEMVRKARPNKVT